MNSFDDIQSLFGSVQAQAIGPGASGMKIYQGAQTAPSGDNAFLWGLLDQVPQDGPILTGGGASFFALYSALIDSLIAGQNPLDPIKAAKNNLAAWGKKPPAWQQGYTTLAKTLKVAPPLEFSFQPSPSPDPGYWGLCTSSSAAPGAVGLFAESGLTMKVDFGHLLLFAPQADDWYTPTAMTTAYQNPSSPPWNPSSGITWESTFGSNGTLRTVVTGLVCVSPLNLTYASAAAYSYDMQAEIEGCAKSGLWPYYLAQDSATNRATFDGSGKLAVTTTTKKDAIILVGAAVMPAAQFFASL
jgi:hypothetical protein